MPFVNCFHELLAIKEQLNEVLFLAIAKSISYKGLTTTSETSQLEQHT